MKIMRFFAKSLISVLLNFVLLLELFCCDNSLTITDQKSDDNYVSVEEVIDTSDEESISEPFIPSNEWQPIRKGQVIPAGLHFRINLETGLKEAKILDESKEQIDKNVKFIDRHKKVTEFKSTEEETKVKSIKEMLKNMKYEEKISEMNDNSNVSETNFRSIDEIKRDFNEMNIKIRSESEVLEILLQKYNNSLIDEKLSLLSDIEYLVHSLDIAQDFVKFNGIPLLLPDLNSTNSQLRAQIAFTIGSAMNGNPRVQIQVFKSGALKELLLLLGSDSSFEVRKKCLFAISSLVRQFPSAQKSLIKEYGALTIFAQLFQRSDFNSIKLSSKVVTLLNDLFIERQLTSEFRSNEEIIQIKLKQYHEIDLNQAIFREGFCSLIPNLLNSGDNEIIEKTIEAMDSFSVICRKDFQKSLSLLRKIGDNFKILSKSETNEESKDFYFTDLYKLLLDLINKLKSDMKDEL